MRAGLSWREAAGRLCVVFPGLLGYGRAQFGLCQPVVTTSVALTDRTEEMNR